MLESLSCLKVGNGDPVRADQMPTALSAGTLAFGDGATQTFAKDGHTTYIERGEPTRGEWWVVGDGEFGSFWPPNYRATYLLSWLVEDDAVVGLVFTQTGRGTRFEGRYQ